jgi:phage shock protein A
VSIRRRITAIVRSTRTAPAQAPDPLVSLDASYQQQLDMLEAARRSTADVAAHRRRVQLLAGQAGAQVESLNRQAEAAVAAGDDDAARDALRGALTAGKRWDALDGQQRALDSQLRGLEQTLERLEQRIEDARLHYLRLRANYSAAQAALGMQDALRVSGQGAVDARSAADAAEREVRRLQALAAAHEELAWSDPNSHQVREAFEELETRLSAEAALSRLRARTDPAAGP